MITKFLQYLQEKMEHPISNVEDYLEGMKVGLNDKIFFLQHIKPDIIVDFGCADGTILNHINKLYPNIKLYGYDIEPSMYSSNNNPNITFTNYWENIERMLMDNGDKNICLSLSSVIHEVYSYSTPKQVNDFWKNKVFNPWFKWVAIRDMIPSSKYDKYVYSKWLTNQIKHHYDKKFIDDFENKWGKISDSTRSLLHFLLKYKYKDNWTRENNENYVPISLETLKKKIPPNWNIIYEKHFLPEFLSQNLINDFGIEIDESTHLKMILEK